MRTTHGGMKRTVRALVLAVVSSVVAVMAVASGAALGGTIYNNIPAKLPGNFASVGFEATQTAQFGGQVEFLTNSITRKSPTVTLVMSSWACEKGRWTWPSSGTLCVTKPGAKFKQKATLKIYNVGAGNTVGSLVAEQTHEFEMPFRPTASSKCTGSQAGEWFQGSTTTCFHGKAFKIAFSLPGVILPAKTAIISVAYNTSDYGAEKQRTKLCNEEEEPSNVNFKQDNAGCPYDSLNVAVLQKGEPGAEKPSVGGYPDRNEVYADSGDNETNFFCSPQSPTPGTFIQSGPCWEEEQPLISVTKAVN